MEGKVGKVGREVIAEEAAELLPALVKALAVAYKEQADLLRRLDSKALTGNYPGNYMVMRSFFQFSAAQVVVERTPAIMEAVEAAVRYY